MTVVYLDGSKLSCSVIHIGSDRIICDGYRYVDFADIDYIED